MSELKWIEGIGYVSRMEMQSFNKLLDLAKQEDFIDKVDGTFSIRELAKTNKLGHSILGSALLAKQNKTVIYLLQYLEEAQASDRDLIATILSHSDHQGRTFLHLAIQTEQSLDTLNRLLKLYNQYAPSMLWAHDANNHLALYYGLFLDIYRDWCTLYLNTMELHGLPWASDPSASIQGTELPYLYDETISCAQRLQGLVDRIQEQEAAAQTVTNAVKPERAVSVGRP